MLPQLPGKHAFVWRTGRVPQGPGKVKEGVTSRPARRGREERGWVSRGGCQSERSIRSCWAKEV